MLLTFQQNNAFNNAEENKEGPFLSAPSCFAGQGPRPRVRVGVAGCGAFGKHHARIYSQLEAAELTGVYDADRGRAQAVAAEYGARATASLDELIEACDAISLAAPTAAHAELGCRILRGGRDLLVEKPIAASLDEADALLAAAGRERILQVGHLERFNPAVRALRPRLTRPMFFEVHRMSVFTPRSLDIDVLLDLMIHDLDLVLSFAGAEIEQLQAVGLPVITSKVDIANVRLTLTNGCVANLTASRVSTERVRKLRWFQPGEYISLDYARQDAHIYALRGPAARLMRGEGAGRAASWIPALPHNALTSAAWEALAKASLKHELIKPETQEPLALELAAFLHSVKTRQPPEADGQVGRKALAAALMARDEIERHAQRLGLE